VSAVCMLDGQRYWVGYEGGQLYYTVDGGLTWTVRVLAAPVGMASVQHIGDIQAWSDHVIFIAAGAADGAANDFGVGYRTFDGGYTWESYLGAQQIAAGRGFNQCVLPKPNVALAVGDTDATPLAMIYNFVE